MAETAMVARGPIPPAPPQRVLAGWAVSGRRSTSALTLTDCSPLAKVQVRASWDGSAAARLGVGHGRAMRTTVGIRVLLVGSGPGEWLALGPPGEQRCLTERLTSTLSDEHATLVDLTHGRALLRLTGAGSADLLARECASDLDDAVRPDGTAWRTLVAGVVTDLVRDDRAGTPSYLLACDRSVGRYLADTLLDVGAPLGLEVDGFDLPGV